MSQFATSSIINWKSQFVTSNFQSFELHPASSIALKVQGVTQQSMPLVTAAGNIKIIKSH
jgi:hypothetical protein